ncbi:MAG: SurA N-terminal domain-containing protein [Gammaproteobacteria bacterium]|nr:SurA N-terminal domain-containing protein [Gammaproteobacteria bacterium]MBT8151285.1 SurA N-terminal domain-containing protein [Gammaproteobacteria bacterium]NND38729.1 hypothetical protein [Pseudomonadales bacterium]NNM12193.1 hypothetical protein [Pseudomonadales bacterium]
MLRKFRDGIKGRAGKVLLAIIIVPFVLFGAESLLTGGGGPAAVLEVNGKEVDGAQLAQQMLMLRNQTAANMGENIDYAALSEERLRPQAIDFLIQAAVVEQAFEKMALSTPERMIQQSIVRTPDFQVDGKFSNQQMSRVLADNGFNLNILKQRLAEELRIGQLRSAIGQSSFVTDENTALLIKILNEKRRAELIELGPEQVQIGEIDEASIEQFYQTHESEFVTQRTVDAEYLLLDQQDLVESVEDAEVRAEYELQMEQFEASERRRVAHILLAVGEDGEQDQQAAEARALELSARIKAGERFADLAKQYSADTVSAEDGGDLGFTARDGTFPEAFENTVYELAEGEVSGPVVTDAGVHVITVTEIEEVDPPGFEELRASIVDQIQQRKASRQFATLLERVADVAFNAIDLKEPAEVAGTEPKAVEGIAQSGLQGEAASINENIVFNNPRVLAALFEAEVLQDRLNSELIELSDTQAVVLRVTRENEPRQQSLDEVRERVVARLREQKIATELERLAEEVRAAASAAGELASVAKDKGLDVREDLELTRQSSDVPQAVRDAIFQRAKSAAGAAAYVVDGEAGKKYVYRINEVVEEADVMDEQQQAFFAQQMAAMTANQEIFAYLESLRESAEVKRF